MGGDTRQTRSIGRGCPICAQTAREPRLERPRHHRSLWPSCTRTSHASSSRTPRGPGTARRCSGQAARCGATGVAHSAETHISRPCRPGSVAAVAPTAVDGERHLGERPLILLGPYERCYPTSPINTSRTSTDPIRPQTSSTPAATLVADGGVLTAERPGSLPWLHVLLGAGVPLWPGPFPGCVASPSSRRVARRLEPRAGGSVRGEPEPSRHRADRHAATVQGSLPVAMPRWSRMGDDGGGPRADSRRWMPAVLGTASW